MKVNMDINEVGSVVELLSELVIHQGSLRDKQEILLDQICQFLGVDFYVKSCHQLKVDGQALLLDQMSNLDQSEESSFQNQLWQNIVEQNFDLSVRSMFHNHELLYESELNDSKLSIHSFFDDKNGSLIYSSKKNAELHISLVLFREAAEFSLKEMKFLRVFLKSVPWFYEVTKENIRLSPRLTETLNYLLGGEPIKAIAHKMDLSDHTVRGYIKELYKHFNVSSRSELMSGFLRTKS